MSEEHEFDIDAGVAEIAEGMGFGNSDDDFNDDEGEEDGLQDQETETTEEVNETNETKQAPSSWSKEQHDNWSKIPKEAQEYVELREKQMLDGIEQYKQGYQQAIEMHKVLEPFLDNIQRNGLNETEAVHNLFSYQLALTEGSAESRQNAFVQLGQSLGLIPVDGATQTDNRTRELQQRLERIERQEQQRAKQSQQQIFNRVEKEVSDFAADSKNEYFDEVADDVVMLLQSGLDLQAAYDRAVWANPITRAKELSKSTQQQTAKKTEAARAAKRASSTNIRPLNTSKVSNQPTQSWDDTMNETLARLRSN